ncbi:hypothetical protein [Corynebacterium glutamicum]|uniref:hypothetical protein n=1 Tax=Corynebacterium glutamicum TaxID=1718 RepID=UPI001B8CE505|nr:hypothetical protein [Corynebacterium glutamicum]
MTNQNITTDRFTPINTGPYGRGEDGEIFQSKEEADAYIKRTMAEALANGRSRSKSVTVNYATREDLIRRFVISEVEDALEDAMSVLVRTVESRDATADEIRKALHYATDLEDMFNEWLEDNDA